jgi:hypothetical protein
MLVEAIAVQSVTTFRAAAGSPVITTMVRRAAAGFLCFQLRIILIPPIQARLAGTLTGIAPIQPGIRNAPKKIPVDVY